MKKNTLRWESVGACFQKNIKPIDKVCFMRYTTTYKTGGYKAAVRYRQVASAHTAFAEQNTASVVRFCGCRSFRRLCMRIYLDNGATTKMSQAAIHAMLPYMDTIYGNPSSLHSVGQAAAEALADARQRRSPSPPAAARPTIRPFSPPHGWAHEKGNGISSPRPSSITPSCTP